MLAGVCGKRVGFEELLGGSSPSSSPSAKRARCSSFGSPNRSHDFGLGLDLLWILRNQNNRVNDAIESLWAFSSDDAGERSKSQSFESATIGNCDALPASSRAAYFQMPEQTAEDVKTTSDCGNNLDGSNWADLFVQEMMNAANLDDAKECAARILEAFERSITAHSRAIEELEHASLKEHLQGLLNDNQILKRAVTIQHERSMEQEEKAKELENLKLVLSQYQEQVRNLEINNYTLNLHLRRALSSSSPGQYLPDIY